MLRLTLVRHAKAAPAYADQQDRDRALEPRGRRDALEMGRRLEARGLKPDRILTSPAARALETATLLAGELGLDAAQLMQEERLYLAGSETLLAAARALGGATRHLMIVGHNPGLCEFADELSCERSVDNLPTCAVYSLQFDIQDWRELELASGVDAQLDYPEKAF